MIALDASVLVAYLAHADPHHRSALMTLRLDTSYLAHTITLTESLVKPEREGRSGEVIARFERLGVREADRLDGESGLIASVRVATGLKVPDCCVLMLAESARIPLATFDRRLASAARARGIEVVDV